MATGTILVFEEAKEYLLDGGFAGADDIRCAILDNTATPTAAFATPALADFTEVGVGGTYVAKGVSLGDLTSMVTEAAGVMKFDSATNPTWAQHAGNDTDAWWGLIFNETDTTPDRAIAFVELGGPVNMATGALTITWPAGGIFTIT